MPFFLLLFFGLLAGAGLADYQNKQATDRFIARCTDKGGIALEAAIKDHHQWLGCYKGLTEIENEEG